MRSFVKASFVIIALALAGCGNGGVIGSGPSPTATPLQPKVTNEFAATTASSQPSGLALGADNYVYFTEFANNAIASLTSGGAVVEYSISGAGGSGTKPFDIVSGPDNNLWFTESGANGTGKIGAMAIATHKVTEYPIAGTPAPTFINVGAISGTLVFSDPGNHAVGEIVDSGLFNNAGCSGQQLCEFALPSGADPMGIAVNSSNQYIYVADYANSQIEIINQTTGALVGSPVKTSGPPYAIVEGPDHNMWFTEPTVAKIGMINAVTGVLSEESAAPATSATALVLGLDNQLYFLDPAQNKIASFSVATPATITEYSIPTANALSTTAPYYAKMILGINGLIYFTEVNANKVAQFDY